MKIAFIEPFFGVSGDMLLSAFISAGLPVDFLKEQLEKVSPEAFEMEVEDVLNSGVKAKRLKFLSKEKATFRNFKVLKKLILESSVKEEIKDKSLKSLKRLADIESRIHGVEKNKVHFHELGAMDTLLDIAGFYICLDYFEIKEVFFPVIPLGEGYFKSQHGYMPVPSYATLELLKNYEVRGVSIQGENITPTGALLLTTSGKQSLFPQMHVKYIGYGSGSFSFGDFPNLVRLSIGDKEDSSNLIYETIGIIEFQIDDMSPELLACFFENVMGKGALDVYMTPIYMKKNRPGILFTILFKEENLNDILDSIFKETTTIGIRIKREQRIILPREEVVIKTKYGKIRVKKSYYNGRKIIKPEFEDVKLIAKKHKISVNELYDKIRSEIKK
jgi:uncharacterized protein (TIGR00299 family) protein